MIKLNKDFWLTPEEIAHIIEEGKCPQCPHLMVFHSRHCCYFCWIKDCGCDEAQEAPQ